MLEGLDTIDWNSISHCYGIASDIPEILNSLLIAQTNEEFEKLRWHLDNILAHQGDISDAVPFVIPFLGQILHHSSLPKYVYDGVEDSINYYCVQAEMWLEILEQDGSEIIQRRFGTSPEKLESLVRAISTECEKIFNEDSDT